jgi:hypothetical protein
MPEQMPVSKKRTYIVLLQPVIALNGASGEEIVTWINPVTLGISSWRMPFGRDFQELLNGIRVSHRNGNLRRLWVPKRESFSSHEFVAKAGNLSNAAMGSKGA